MLARTEQTLRNSFNPDQLCGYMMGALGTLGVENIWYSYPMLMLGQLFETGVTMPTETRIAITEISRPLMALALQRLESRGLLDTPHVFDSPWSILVDCPDHHRLHDLLAPEYERIESGNLQGIYLPIAGGTWRATMILGGDRSIEEFQYLTHNLDRLGETVKVFHDCMKRLIQPLCARLSESEIVATHWAALGKTTWEIAQIEQVSESAITKRLSNAMQKVGATNKAHLVSIASQAGLYHPLVAKLSA